MDMMILILGVIALFLGLGAVTFAMTRARPEPQADLAAELRALSSALAVLEGRSAEAIQRQSQSQRDLQEALNTRLAQMDERVGISMKESTETLGGLRERLKVIDEAQKTLAEMSGTLSGQVVGLSQILSNKQSRGAYGQGHMESIIRDALPQGAYEFQATLSNGKRPDCVIHLPGTKTAIVIDSKFPLEGFELLKAATNDAERKAASARVKSDLQTHVQAIAGHYLIAGETQDPAIMFVPSESIYAELHDSFPDVIARAHRARVVVVSPNILLLAVNTVQTVLKDARMREQANLIQKEVGELLRDVSRLSDRVGNLQRHLKQTDGDMQDILTSTGKITSRAEKIEKVEFGNEIKPALN